MSSQTLQQPTAPVADEDAVRALYQRMMEAWNQGCGEAFAAPFDDEGDFIAFDGTHFKSRREIASSHQPLFDKWLKGTRLVGQVTIVRFLSPDVALMHAVGGTVKERVTARSGREGEKFMRGNSVPSPERDSIQTLVATRRGGERRLAAFQNTRVRPRGRNVAGTLVWMLSDWLWKVSRPKK